MKALVTGGTGFIGSHLTELLCAEGFQVRCIAREEINRSSIERKNVDVILADLNGAPDWEGMLGDVDIVFHLAGVTRARVMKDYYTGNREATRNLVEACLAHARRCRRFVFVSSLTAAGPRRGAAETDEATPCRPVSHYGRSKRLAELEVARLADRIPYTILRPSMVYGPRDRDTFQYFQLVRFGIEPMIGFHPKECNIIHVGDLVKGILLAAENPAAVEQIFFLGSERNYTLHDVSDVIALVEGRHPVRIPLPNLLLYCCGSAAGLAGKLAGRATLFNLQKAREAAQKAWTCSVGKAKALLGFRPQIGLDEGMRLTYDWYRCMGWL